MTHQVIHSADGDPEVQDSLVDVLRDQLLRQQLKEEIEEDLVKRKEALRRIGEELQAELQESYELEKFRAELGTSNALSETMQKFDELEAELQAIQEQTRRDSVETEEWEQQSAVARSQGLFFQTLYQREKGKPVGGLLPDANKLATTTAAIRDTAAQQARSPFRMYLFGYLGALLAAAVGHDLLSAQPSLPLDAGYVALGGALGWYAYSERQQFADDKDGDAK